MPEPKQRVKCPLCRAHAKDEFGLMLHVVRRHDRARLATGEQFHVAHGRGWGRGRLQGKPCYCWCGAYLAATPYRGQLLCHWRAAGGLAAHLAHLLLAGGGGPEGLE